MNKYIDKSSKYIFISIFYLIIYDIYLYNISDSINIINGVIIVNYLFYIKILKNYNNLKKIISILLIYIFYLKGNVYTFIVGMKLLNSNLRSQQPTPPHLIRTINSIIENQVSLKMKSLIDFGCGDCNTLSQLNFNYKIGIEYDKNIYQNALNEIKYRNYRIDEIVNSDIVNYNFKNDFILYMYEPLWNKNDNNSIYIKLFDKLKNINSNIDIIYITGILSKKLDNNFFKRYNFNVIEKRNVDSIFLNRIVYYCKKYKI